MAVWPDASDDELIEGARTRVPASASSDHLIRLLRNGHGAQFARELADRVARPRHDATAARELAAVIDEVGLPEGLRLVDRWALRLGTRLAPRAPRLVMPIARERLRRQTRRVVLPAEDGPLARHLARRRRQGFLVNLNLLGEAILGDREAMRRLADTIALIERPDVDAVSIKASAIVANLSSLAFDDSIGRLSDAMRSVLVVAARKGTLVMFDMEEYRDLELTLRSFIDAMADRALSELEAGIVVQAYLPDSVAALETLAGWAVRRHAATGARTKVRLVKGANLLMERVEAELHGWKQAPYNHKHDVDANFKRLIEYALAPDRLPALRVGVGSHNPFDIAWTLELRARSVAPSNVEFEMLEGMAPGLAAELNRRAGPVMLYTPIVRKAEFPSAVAYLARRVDEVSAPQNVLGRLEDLRPGRTAYTSQSDAFADAVRRRQGVSTSPRRDQDRRHEPAGGDAAALPFANASDTDFARPANRDWVAAARRVVPRDPPRKTTTVGEIDRMAETAQRAGERWAATAPAARRDVLLRVAHGLESRRGEAIAHMVGEGHKIVAEADVEVSEAVDYARYYASIVESIAEMREVAAAPARAVLVVPPWNFPYAIPAGGVLAALAAGSAAVLKPAPQTRATARLLTDVLAEAGVPEGLVHNVNCDENEIGRHLITHDAFGAVILTGSIETARLFRSWKPTLHLHAETSGKNAIVVTNAADLDQAVRDVVRSAFGHAGQKCSAASLLIAEAAVYDDARFRAALHDATASLAVGPSTRVETAVGPLIGAPSPQLERALTTLDAGEIWLVEPKRRQSAPHLWSPGVRLGVVANSWFHQTECFGPVLGVMRADDLDHAIELQNGVPYGLTGGIQSLSPAEVVRWLERVEVGNAYVNRPITGAVVRRQPFGGWKASAVGPGTKAGGPNYVLSLCSWSATPTEPAPDIGVPPAVAAHCGASGALLATARGFLRWWHDEFGAERDVSQLQAESNRLRYRPLPRGVLLIADHTTDQVDVARARIAAEICGTPLRVCAPSRFAAECAQHTPDRVRLIAAGNHEALWRHAAALDLYVDDHPIVDHGRLELWRWLREQSVSEVVHRYGVTVGTADSRKPKAISSGAAPG